MIRAIILMSALLAGPATAQDTSQGNAGVLRILDKVAGNVTDMELATGETGTLGLLKVTLTECRYPALNPSGNAYALVSVVYRDIKEPVFSGWLIASAPAVNAMDHPRYDVWALRCNSS